MRSKSAPAQIHNMKNGAHKSTKMAIINPRRRAMPLITTHRSTIILSPVKLKALQLYLFLNLLEATEANMDPIRCPRSIKLELCHAGEVKPDKFIKFFIFTADIADINYFSFPLLTLPFIPFYSSATMPSFSLKAFAHFL